MSSEQMGGNPWSLFSKKDNNQKQEENNSKNHGAKEVFKKVGSVLDKSMSTIASVPSSISKSVEYLGTNVVNQNVAIKQKGLNFENGNVTDNDVKLEPLKCAVGVNCKVGAIIKKIIKEQISGADETFRSAIKNVGDSNIDNLVNVVNAEQSKRLAILNGIIDIKSDKYKNNKFGQQFLDENKKLKLPCKIHVKSINSSHNILDGEIISLDIKNKKFVVQFEHKGILKKDVNFSDLCIGSKDDAFGVSTKCDLNRIDENDIQKNASEQKLLPAENANIEEQKGGKKKKSKKIRYSTESDNDANNICE